MSRWDIFRWRTLAGGPPCRQGRQRFSHQAFLSPRPKRVPPFGISDGGGHGCVRALASCPLSRLTATASRLLALSVTAAAVPAPPKGEPSRQLTRGLQKAKSRLPLWGRCPPKEGGEGNPPPPRTCTGGSHRRGVQPPVSPAGSVGPERSPLGTRTPKARIDSGGTPPVGKDASLFP